MRIVAEQHSSEFDSLENCAIQVPVEDNIQLLDGLFREEQQIAARLKLAPSRELPRFRELGDDVTPGQFFPEPGIPHTVTFVSGRSNPSGYLVYVAFFIWPMQIGSIGSNIEIQSHFACS
jgi:hypothetical protein